MNQTDANQTMTQSKVAGILSAESGLTRGAVLKARGLVRQQPQERAALQAAMEDLKGLPKALALWCLGFTADAEKALASFADEEIAAVVLARLLRDSGQIEEAVKTLAPWSRRAKARFAQVERLETLVAAGDFDEASTIVKALLDSAGTNPEVLYAAGLYYEATGGAGQAIDAYMKALEADAEDANSAFRLGFLFDLRGDEAQAISYYQRCADMVPSHENALMNLATLYEDMGDTDKAIRIYQRLLRTRPAHSRARSFLKDAVATLHMYYDENEERKADQFEKILKIPVSDFELSVRSRNCLTKMEIKILGDLVKKTEAEILSYKNFGETSLNEIKEMLATKGLHLGMKPEVIKSRDLYSPYLTPPVSPHLTAPVAELALSARSQRLIEGLGLQTIGELVGLTEEELLSHDNFGKNSLKELQEKLASLGLALKSE